MHTSWKSAPLTVLVFVVACSSPGLPPAGPKPGDVDIGYGTQPAANVTGSVKTFSEEEIVASRAQNIPELLRRHNLAVPGLLVLDGVASGNTSLVSTLNLHEIRQIDVLKDVSSTAIYGQRGRNGVLVVTTRR